MLCTAVNGPNGLFLRDAVPTQPMRRHGPSGSNLRVANNRAAVQTSAGQFIRDRHEGRDWPNRGQMSLRFAALRLAALSALTLSLPPAFATTDAPTPPPAHNGGDFSNETHPITKAPPNTLIVKGAWASSSDAKLIENLVQQMGRMKLPTDAGRTSGVGGGNAPECVPDYARDENVLERVGATGWRAFLVTVTRAEQLPARGALCGA
jgi:hypothetical protein